MEPRDKRCSFYSHDLDKVSLADLVTFIEEILNGKLHFLCSGWFGFVTFAWLIDESSESISFLIGTTAVSVY